eukprot:g251.t1
MLRNCHQHEADVGVALLEELQQMLPAVQQFMEMPQRLFDAAELASCFFEQLVAQQDLLVRQLQLSAAGEEADCRECARDLHEASSLSHAAETGLFVQWDARKGDAAQGEAGHARSAMPIPSRAQESTMLLFRLTIAAVLCSAAVEARAFRSLSTSGTCRKHNVNFILNQGDSTLMAIEDDIRANLELVGFSVKATKLTKDQWNAAHVSGDFSLSFSETWGAPYDPHGYASGWLVGNEGHKQALKNLQHPMTRDALFASVTDVLKEEDNAKAAVAWQKILGDVHNQAVMLPLWGKRIPTVMNKRLSGYEAGVQQYDYPVHKLKVASGSKTVTIAPGSQSGLFATVGPVEAHTYRPNEFFVSNWIYEGLVAYSKEGVVPALAKSWTISDLAGGKQQFTFTLRPGVKFHDGEDWNCAAAKLNFDHVFAPPFVTPDWHAWYELPKVLESWRCDSPMTFTLIAKSKYGPLLQELSYIRPLRMVSPAAFANGAASDALTHNSCREAFGTATGNGKTLTCKGIKAPIGTGPFKYSSRVKLDPTKTGIRDTDKEVTFVRHTAYWGGAPEIETLVIKYYADSASIKAALDAGTLDLMWGGGALSPSDLVALQKSTNTKTYYTEAIQNVLLLLNSGAAPLNDIQVRKALIHAVDKMAFIDKELYGLQKPVDNVFPRGAPFCDVDFDPKWDYDFEKAEMLCTLGCKQHSVNFILNQGDSTLMAIEDDIRANLELVGFSVKATKLTKDQWNAAHVSGDFSLSFSETWGAPYDPHGYASGWLVGNEGHKQALKNLQHPMTRDALFASVTDVLKEEDNAKAAVAWQKILGDVHNQAVMLPLWGKRIPTVMNKRLSGYEAGVQQYDYPVHKLKVASGSKTVTIAPGSQSGLFATVGPVEAHTYRPNEFFVSNWIYEGLVAYSKEGVVPALAKSWTISDLAGGKQQFTFTLRPGVKFHDGEDWNCAAAKLNFDHVFAPPFVTPDWHAWYELPKVLESWRCDSPMTFTLIAKSKYGPLLQELSYIRPLRMVSPAAFANGAASDALTHNSCREAFGTATGNGKTLTCKGIKAPIGTGPFKYSSRVKLDPTKTGIRDTDKEVTFVRHTAYWGGAPEIETLVIKYYADSASIKAALDAGTLDLMWGGGALSPSDLVALQKSTNTKTYYTEAIQNVLLLLNSGAAPLNDIQVRKALIHAVDKMAFIDKELYGLQKPVDNVFPRGAPFCDVELRPKWSYDFQKASLLSECGAPPPAPARAPATTPTPGPAPAHVHDDDDKKNTAIGLGVGVTGVLALVLLGVTLKLRAKNKELEYKLVSLQNTPAAAQQAQVVPKATETALA